MGYFGMDTNGKTQARAGRERNSDLIWMDMCKDMISYA